MAKKYKVEINNIENLKELLQHTFDLADEQLIQAQNEINKLANSTQLQEEVMEFKAKYAKAINDYLGIKDKAISKKIEIAKLLSELCKHNGDLSQEETKQQIGSLNFDNIREILDKNDENKAESIKLKK